MSELIVGVIPVRSFREGKTRLASILTRDQRATLLRKTASRVVCTLAASQIVDTVLVVSPEREVLEWARGMGKRILPLPQPADQAGLNGALDFARAWALTGAARAPMPCSCGWQDRVRSLDSRSARTAWSGIGPRPRVWQYLPR